MPEDVATSRIEVSVKRWDSQQTMASLEEVWHHGRALENMAKAEMLLAMAEDTSVTVDDIEVDWTVHLSVKGVKVPIEYLQDIEGPEDLERRILEFQGRAQHAFGASPGWSATLLFDVGGLP